MSEIEKALAELKALMKYRSDQLGKEEDFRGLGLTSRKNLCLHPSVKREKSGSIVDARCRSLTAGFVKEKKERGEDVDLCIYHDVWHRRFLGCPGFSNFLRILTSWNLTILCPPASLLSTVYSSTENSISSVHTFLQDAWYVRDFGFLHPSLDYFLEPFLTNYIDALL